MKTLIILALLLLTAFAFFFTRPTKADFETYIRSNTKIVDGQATGGQTVAAKIGQQLKTFVADQTNQSAADYYISQCTVENHYLWTTVRKDGQVIFTGALGHWFPKKNTQAEPVRST